MDPPADENLETEEMGVRSMSTSHGQAPHVHKVRIPPRQNLFKEFQVTIQETFFPDDPLRCFKDQPKSRKLILGIEAIFPILKWGRSYDLKKFRGDIISGLTIASLCIPQDIGYAKLAHLPPQNALYTSFIPPLIYAAMGSSRDIAIGPVAVVSLLLGTLLSNEIDPDKHAAEYKRLAFTATFFAGITQATLGIFRLGFLIDFLSHAAIVGFMAGAAISISLQQLKGFLGIKNKQGVEIVRHIDKGLNPSSVKEIYFSGEYLGKGLRIGIVSGMIALTENTAIGRTFASVKDYQLDGNKEMVALGVVNVVGSMTSCYVATGSFSRSAVNFMAGCQTAVSNIVMSTVVFLTLLFMTPLFKYTPTAILSTIIIFAVINLVDYHAAISIWKIDKIDFVACMGAFFGVVFASIEIGLLIAISISFARILLQVTRPRTAVLGKIPSTSVYRNIQQYPEASKVAGVVIVRVDSAIYFSNSNYVKERILRWLVDEEEQVKGDYHTKIQFLIVEMSAVADIDTTGIRAFKELQRSLEMKGVKLVLANPGPAVIDKLYASNFVNMIGKDRIFINVAEAVAYCSPRLVGDP
ncbi:hypothetical protein RJT34_09853 [Clitoria ternatea]|uniref:STAS domain-containing protein n=1 Tax=Clitoria ternatea TaxID=43366 RepID=A0AAN9K8P4_CLITE